VRAASAVTPAAMPVPAAARELPLRDPGPLPAASPVRLVPEIPGWLTQGRATGRRPAVVFTGTVITGTVITGPVITGPVVTSTVSPGMRGPACTAARSGLP
jgi:hypothetical protein